MCDLIEDKKAQETHLRECLAKDAGWSVNEVEMFIALLTRGDCEYCPYCGYDFVSEINRNLDSEGDRRNAGYK